MTLEELEKGCGYVSSLEDKKCGVTKLPENRGNNKYPIWYCIECKRKMERLRRKDKISVIQVLRMLKNNSLSREEIIERLECM